MGFIGALRPAVPRARAAAWMVYAAVIGVVAVLLALGVRDARALGPFASTSAVLAVLLGVHLHRPRGTTPWRLLAGGMALCAVPGIVGRPLFAPLYLVGELMFVAAALAFLSRRQARLERAAIIDASIITLGFAAITWLYLLGPYAEAARENGIAVVWAVGSSSADVLLVGAGSLFMLGALRQSRAAQLLLGSMLGLYASHVIFLWNSLHGGHQSDGAGGFAWLALCGLLGAAALHPSMARLCEPAPKDDRGLTRGRLAVLSVTSMLAPAAAIAQAVLGEPRHVVISIASGVIFVLVLLRAADLVRVHEAVAQTAQRVRFESRFGALVRNASDVVSIVDAEGRMLYASPAALRLVGLPESDTSMADWWEYVHPEDQSALKWFLVHLAPGGSGGIEYRVRDAQGAWRDVETLATNLLGDGAVEGIVLNTRDVTERKALQRRLQHQATHDTLTGLPNRMLLRDRLEQALARRQRTGSALAVIFLDLDDFKNVNDTLGHAAGDAVLQEVAKRLDGCIRGSDTATRIGGDEFAVLLDELCDESQAVVVAERILEALHEPIEILGRVIDPNGSLGIAFAADGRETADALLRYADAAMYLAKDRGKGAYAIYEPAMHAAAVARLQLKVDLARAIADQEITLAYQPVIDLRNGEIRAYESLARWTHPTRGPVSPGEFIPLAEETGLIVALGRDLLHKACRQAAVFQAAETAGAPLRVSVNVSARQLASDDLVSDVRAAVEGAGIQPRDLILELTESAMMSDLDLAASRLAALRELGVGLAVDDFGTGYSSLNSIRSFPVDRLKIDRSFTAHLDDARTRALTQTIVELGAVLDMMVVAEGIEQASHIQRILELGCPFGQGYFIQRPMSPDDVLAYLAEHGRWITLPALAAA